MINLSEQGNTALDAIRSKVEHRDPRWTGPELDKLEAVYSEITMLATGKETKPIDRTCSSCINRAVGIAYNYITFHEQIPVDRQAPAKVIDIKTGNGTELVGTIGINNWANRKAKLESLGFIYSKEENLFKFGEDPEHVVDGNTIGALSEAAFQIEVDRILEAEKGNDTGQAFDQHNPTAEVVADRIEQLMGLGYTYDPDNAQYNAPESKSMVTAAALQTMPAEDWNMFIDAEEGFQHSHKAKPAETLPKYNVETPGPGDGVTGINLVKDSVNGDFVQTGEPEEDLVKLIYDPKTDQVVIEEKDGSHTPFTEDLDVLLFPVLWDLGKQKGWKGARPPKAKLVEFLTKPTK